MKLTPNLLALYLGCKVKCDDGRIRILTGICQASDSSTSFRIQTRMDDKSNVYWQDIDMISLLLRKLEDMTEEEARECLEMKYNIGQGIRIDERRDSGYWYQHLGFDGTPINGRQFIYFIQLTESPKQVAYLLSKSFDLFGLIESSEAIDAKTLKL